MITRREAKEIVDWVLRELHNRTFPYTTDSRVDFSKITQGTISGTPTVGGQIADGAIYDRHVHPNADIAGTKIKLATLVTPGVVYLGTDGNAYVPTMSGLLSVASGLGASLIGIFDTAGVFSSDNVEDALHEVYLIAQSGVDTFLALVDTPASFYNKSRQASVVNDDEDGLEFKPIDYIDGGDFNEAYAGAITDRRDYIDGGAFTRNNIVDGGSF